MYTMFDSFVRCARALYGHEKPIALHEPRFGDVEKDYLNRVIDSTFVSSVGAYVGDFERLMGDFTQSKHAIATVNGTSALHVALLLAGVKPGDAVITQSLSFVATCNAVAYCGANPWFIDVDEQTMGLSAKKLLEFLKSQTEIKEDGCHHIQTGQRLAACLPMHTLGHPVEIEAIAEICQHYRIPLVEDAAEALGSFYKGRHLGTFGRLGVLSFNGNKVITTGGGGMILTDDDHLAQKAKHLTTTAKLPHAFKFEHDELGFNYRMPNLNAALGCAQMLALPGFLESKRRVAETYSAWSDANQVSFFKEPEAAHSNYWLNALILKSEAERDSFLQFTNEAQVMTRPLWTPMHRLPMYAACRREDLEVTEKLASRVVNIPSSALQSSPGSLR